MRRWLAAVICVLLALAAPAAAHEGAGALEVLSADPAGPLAVSYRVRLTFRADGHPARDATVTAVALTPDGSSSTPQQLGPTAEEGVYAGTVTFPQPGAWTVRFTSVTPGATLERPETVTAPPTTASTRASTTTTLASAPPTATRDAGGSGSNVPALPVAVIAGAAVLAALTLGWRRQARRTRQ